MVPTVEELSTKCVTFPLHSFDALKLAIGFGFTVTTALPVCGCVHTAVFESFTLTNE